MSLGLYMGTCELHPVPMPSEPFTSTVGRMGRYLQESEEGVVGHEERCTVLYTIPLSAGNSCLQHPLALKEGQEAEGPYSTLTSERQGLSFTERKDEHVPHHLGSILCPSSLRKSRSASSASGNSVRARRWSLV